MSLDPVAWSDRDDVVGVVGCSLADSSVWPLGVVVLDVFLEQASELVFVPDDGSVQEFVAQRAHPSFGKRVCLGRSRRYPNSCDVGPCKDSVEGAGELSGSVADHEPKPMTVAESHREVACGLGCPGSGRVGGDPEKMDAPCRVFDDEEDMEPFEEGGVDASEVGGEDACCLGANELCPCGPGPVAGRVDASGFEDFPNSGRGDGMSESVEFSVDSPVSPVGFSAANRMIRARIWGSMGGRPRGLIGGCVQCPTIRRLCQRSTVSGLTIRNALLRRDLVIADPRRARMVRSVLVKCGRLIWRCRTRSWWRSARISASRASPVANIHVSRLITRRTRAGNRVTSEEGSGTLRPVLRSMATLGQRG